MKFTLETPTAVTIRSISSQEIRIGEQRWLQPVAVTSAGLLDDWLPKSIEALTAADFDTVLGTDPEIIVLGTGSKQILPPRELVFAMARRGVGFEVMDSRAAARTFNVLVAEGRQIAAILYL